VTRKDRGKDDHMTRFAVVRRTIMVLARKIGLAAQ
jgi:hypothetical protein